MTDASRPGDAEFDGYYGTLRPALLDLIDTARAPTHALDIGCGTGALLAELSRRHPGCRTVGLERHADAARRARAVAHDVVEADVLDPALDLPAGHFDLVVLSHVLEHFAEPQAVLERVRGWLAPGGSVLVALPNVRHLSVVVPLLCRADFRYAPAGILDRTHLRFYTRRSALRFFDEQHWRVERCRADVQGTKSVWLDRLSLGLARDFAAYAYGFRVRPT